MRTTDEHAALAVALASAPVAIDVPLREAVGLVTAAPIVAAVQSPPFDNSAMDGFAVRWEDVRPVEAQPEGDQPTDASPVTLVVGESRAGLPASRGPGPGEAIRIMTGAVMPPGADTVIAQEATTFADGVVRVKGAHKLGAHVRRRGEDAQVGDEVVPVGVELAARHIASAATVGASTVRVFRSPRVGILSTGDELVPVGGTLGEGQIFESNSSYLEAAVRAVGGTPVLLGSVGDTVEGVLAGVASPDVDLIVTTGGVSVGAYDVVKAALAGAGVEFLNVAMQPGKPQGLGVVSGRPVVCLPGNPVAVAVSFENFVEPVIRAMRGLEPFRAWNEAKALASWTTPVGREQFIPVLWVERSGGPGEGDREAGVSPATSGGSGSHLMARLARADALARIPANVDQVNVGDTVRVRRFGG